MAPSAFRVHVANRARRLRGLAVALSTPPLHTASVPAARGTMLELMLWADLKQKDLARLDEAADEAASRAILADALKVPTDDALRHDVLLEFYMNNLRFVRARSMSDEKTSTYFSIMKRVHEEACEALMTPQNSWEYFKALLLAHSVQRPPYSVGVFTLADAQTLTAHALETYFRHFKLYRYAFTMQHSKELTLRSSWIEVCLCSLPEPERTRPLIPVAPDPTWRLLPRGP